MGWVTFTGLPSRACPVHGPDRRELFPGIDEAIGDELFYHQEAVPVATDIGHGRWRYGCR